MPDILVEPNGDGYMVYAIYKNPARRVFLFQADRLVMNALEEHFSAQSAFREVMRHQTMSCLSSVPSDMEATQAVLTR